MKIRPEQRCSVWTERQTDIRIDRRTDEQQDMTKLMVTFRMLANARHTTIKDLVTAIH